MNPDLIIHAGWIVPVNPAGTVLEAHSIAIGGGRILAVLPTAEARTLEGVTEELELPGHALIPGLINAHTHAAMSLLRGLADDLPLMEWLNGHIWPAEQKWVSEEFVHDGTLLAMAEMLRGGVTCFNDMYFFPDCTARAAVMAGMRATIGLIVLDFPTVWAADADEYLSRGLEIHDQFRNDALIRTAFAPHAPYSVSDGPLERIRMLADELEIPVHMHVHETADEVRAAVMATGKRPLRRLAEMELLSSSLMAVHMTQLDAEDKALLYASGASVIHCPESNLKLASGFCPVTELAENGVNVAIGTDGAASNNDLDMIGEMRTAALLAKGVSGDAASVPAADALRMATLNGAAALGIEDETGSLEKGKSADIAAVHLGDVEESPLYHVLSQLVYATGRDKVTDVWIRGRQVLRNRRLTTLDQEAILQRARAWQDRISGRG